LRWWNFQIFPGGFFLFFRPVLMVLFFLGGGRGGDYIMI